jgi:hypothetical protein
MSVYIDKGIVTTIRSGAFGAGTRGATTMNTLVDFVEAVEAAGLGDEKLKLERTLFDEQYRFVVERYEPIEEDSE